MNKIKQLAAAVGLATIASVASAASGSFEVKALENSTTGGNGKDTGFKLEPGYTFSISVDTNDLWNAGALPRWSNANGLTKDLYYPTSTDPDLIAWGAPAPGTLIGTKFPLWTQGGLTAPFGTLVGQIGSGNFFSIGTTFSGTAAASGTLKLFYFDFNNVDNAGSVVAHVNAVPEPETYAMLLAGLGIVGAMARRRKKATAVAG